MAKPNSEVEGRKGGRGGGGGEGRLAVLPMSCTILHWHKRSLLWATCLLHKPGTVRILNAEREKACLVLFLIPSSAPSKFLEQKDEPLNFPQSQLITSTSKAKMEQKYSESP